jgi:hypothetical protein
MFLLDWWYTALASLGTSISILLLVWWDVHVHDPASGTLPHRYIRDIVQYDVMYFNLSPSF